MTGCSTGWPLACNASLLIHDGQYTAEEYAGTRCWGHSTIADALDFAHRAEVERLALFHHDPTHDDSRLYAVAEQAKDVWLARGREREMVISARESTRLSL